MTRIEKLRAKFPQNADAFITTDEKTRLYLSKFHATDGTVFVTKNTAVLYADFRYIEAAEKEAVGVKVVMPTGRVSECVKEIIAAEGIKTVGYEENKLTVADLDRLKSTYAGIEFIPMGSVITNLCVYKDEEEMATIREAQKITDKAFAEVLSVLSPDMTEIDVAAEIEYRMKKLGAICPSFETIAVSGTNSSRPHGVPSREKLQKGFLTMDFGCVYNGYCSDMTRTVCIGKADGDMKKLYDTVLKAQLAAIDAAKLGVKCAAVDKVARDIIDEAGYRGCFGHGLGHGVGLYIHEEPRFSPSAGDVVITPGHVITVEPGIYLKGKYGARIEDMIQATESGVTDITASPKNLIEI
ncbi:MAG: aminopeptidase P family protein [Clostridiales bacterium]|nr:aminopeptidase P family protein [Clostridiales bacterium]